MILDRFREVSRENKRLKDNVLELTKENNSNINLVLTSKEYIKGLTNKADSLLRVLNIKPKEVVRYVERTVNNVVRDTVLVTVYPKQKDWWTIVDTGKCFKWEGDLYKRGEALELWRSNFEYRNKTEEVYFQRREKKFWFIRYGKKKVFRKSVSECEGESVIKIEVTKRGG
jgi:hypothetical protein